MYHAGFDESILEIGVAGDELLAKEGTVLDICKNGGVYGDRGRRMSQVYFRDLCHTDVTGSRGQG